MSTLFFCLLKCTNFLKILDFFAFLWYNIYVVWLEKMYENISLEVKEMFNEDIFNFDINNIKTDLAIEGLTITDEDINLYKQFANEIMDKINSITI